MNTYPALHPSSTAYISHGGEDVMAARAVMLQLFTGALTPAA